MELDDAEYQLKPMNCPFHILIYRDRQHSYRDLPGAARRARHGLPLRALRRDARLLRVRGFTQDDAHIFCTPEQIEDEVVDCLAVRRRHAEHLRLRRTTKPSFPPGTAAPAASTIGTPEQWKLAEDALCNAATRLNMKVQGDRPTKPRSTGPKIDVKLVDAIGRLWQLSTVQFDFTLPRRFDLEYIAEDGKAHQPLMVHRALYGSIERFFGILIEHYAGAFPGVAGAGAGDRAAHHRPPVGVRARQCSSQFDAAGIRATVDDRSEKVNLKIRDAQLQKIPYMLVVGDREAQSGQVAVRNRKHGDQGAKPVAIASRRYAG